MKKPVAFVSWSATSMSGTVTISTPDTDEGGAHCAQATADAIAASGRWGSARPFGENTSVVTMNKPADRRIGGGALREAVKYATQDARDAAKACLRGLGYTVRSS